MSRKRMQLPAHRLYILSGSAQGARAAWARRLLEMPGFESSIVSETQIRREVLGDRPVPGHSEWAPYESQQKEIGTILRARVEARLAQWPTTFIDGTHISDEERKPWFDLARRYGVKAGKQILTEVEPMTQSVSAHLLPYISDLKDGVLRRFRINGENENILTSRGVMRYHS